MDMPKINDFNMIKKIKTLDHECKVIAMIKDRDFIPPKQRFLEFFGVNTIDEFLYTTSSSSHWYEKVVEYPETLFRTKIQNFHGENRYLILKLREVAQKEKHCILSFDDMTELNLMALYDGDTAKNDLILKDKKFVLSMLDVIKNKKMLRG